MIGKGVFVTGTDTGVGKTVAAAALLCRLREGGLDAVPMKPIQTGGVRCGNRWESLDLRFCLEMAGLEPSPGELPDMAPWILEPECSPHLAAGLTGRKISFEPVADSLGRLAERHDFVVAEGAGGVLVPIEGERTMLDLMVLLGLPVLIVSRPGLGTINHTLLSLRVLRDAGLDVAGVVFCETEAVEWGEIENDNRRTIERLGDLPVLGAIPHIDGLDADRVPPGAFREICRSTLLEIGKLLDRGM